VDPRVPGLHIQRAMACVYLHTVTVSGAAAAAREHVPRLHLQLFVYSATYSFALVIQWDYYEC
jgi:hypothetical protein